MLKSNNTSVIFSQLHNKSILTDLCWMASKVLLFRLETRVALQRLMRLKEEIWFTQKFAQKTCLNSTSLLSQLLVTFWRHLGPEGRKTQPQPEKVKISITINMAVVLISFSLEVCWHYFVPHTPPRMPCSRSKEIGWVKNTVSVTINYLLWHPKIFTQQLTPPGSVMWPEINIYVIRGVSHILTYKCHTIQRK